MLDSERTGKSPITLRAKASRMAVSPQELAEALLHIAKHRGKPDMRRMASKSDDEEERGLVNSGIKLLRSEMDRLGFDTYGQYLRWREKRGQPTRINPVGRGKGKQYTFYPSRALLAKEFDWIWACQQREHPGALHLADHIRDRLRDELFFQREVTFPPPGNCPYHPNEQRLAKATRLFQERRIYEIANHLRFHNRRGEPINYNRDMRDRVVDVLRSGRSLRLSGAASRPQGDNPMPLVDIREVLGLSQTDTVNFEQGDVPRTIEGYPIDHAFESASLGPIWRAFSLEDQDAALDALASTESQERVRERLKRIFPTEEAIDKALAVSLPRGYGRMGVTATRAILDVLKSKVVPARVAEDRAGMQHAMTPRGRAYERLPYYGEVLEAHTVEALWVSNYRRDTDMPPATSRDEQRFGRVPNPVVHVAMNQLRRMINEILPVHGLPCAIHIELSRELRLSQEEREERTKKNAERQEDNQRIREELKKLGVALQRRNIQRYRLWEDQGHQCVYTGETIACTRLFGSDINVDHIIPRASEGYGVSMSAIDSMGNRVVCLQSANAEKGARTPHEAFGHSPGVYDWAAIRRRARNLGPSKLRRFNSDAAQAFAMDESFRGRDGTDNAYIARIARQYLSCLYGGDQNRVTAVSSYITALLRGKWGLSSVFGNTEDGAGKSRDDHRHHYVDALVAACATQGIIQSIQTESARCASSGIDDFVKKIEVPFKDEAGFYASVKESLATVAVSRKPDHSTAGQLHEDTLIGVVSGPDAQGRYVTVKHKSVDDYKSFDDLRKAKIQSTLPQCIEVENARQKIETVRRALIAYEESATEAVMAEIRKGVEQGRKDRQPSKGEVYRQALKMHERNGGAKSFSLFERRKLVNVRMSGNRTSGGYVSGRNHRIEFYLDNHGKVRTQTVSMLDANNSAFVPESCRSGNQLIWKAHKDDILLMDEPDDPRLRALFRIAKFNEEKMGVVPITDARPSDGSNRRRLIEKRVNFFCQHRAQRIVTNALGLTVYRFEALPKSGRVPL